MIKLVSLEFLVAVLFIIDLFMIFLLVLFVKRINRIRMKDEEADPEYLKVAASDASEAAAAGSAREVAAMLEPLIEASKDAALEFDQLIREKKKISKDLNDALDSKIISINLLLSRADKLQKQMEEQQLTFGGPVRPEPAPVKSTVLDQQNRIIELYYKQMDIDTIAEQLSIPKGEVQLVIDLKEKFVAMEQAQ